MALELITSSLNTRFGIISALYTNAATYSAAAGNTPLQFIPVYSSYFPINLSAVANTCVPIYTVPTGYKFAVHTIALVISGGLTGAYNTGAMPTIALKEGNVQVFSSFQMPAAAISTNQILMQGPSTSTLTSRSLVTSTLCAVTTQAMANTTGYTEASAAVLISGYLIKV